jgi:hypothetical protein
MVCGFNTALACENGGNSVTPRIGGTSNIARVTGA